MPASPVARQGPRVARSGRNSPRFGRDPVPMSLGVRQGVPGGVAEAELRKRWAGAEAPAPLVQSAQPAGGRVVFIEGSVGFSDASWAWSCWGRRSRQRWRSAARSSRPRPPW